MIGLAGRIQFAKTSPGASILACALPCLVAVLVFIVFLVSPAGAQEGRRVALLIGNGAYEYAPALDNPVNDATDLAATLEKLGFEVATGLDAGKAAMSELIDEFAKSLTGDETVVFFYAGHAIQVRGRNHLAAIDSDIVAVSDLEKETLALQDVLGKLAVKSSRILAFLDACRDNPLGDSDTAASLLVGHVDGLAREDITTRNTFLSYATEPGNVALDGAGRNSPFTKAILANIARPGVDLAALMTDVRRQVFEETAQQQLPWSSSSLLDRVYLSLPADGALPAAPVRTQESTDPASVLAAANELFAAGSFAGAADAYRRAAELGAIQAMTAYGNMLAEGVGVPENRIEAHRWYLKAAESGDAEAQFLVGRDYEQGKGGVAKSTKDALSWYRRAANGGNGDAMNNLAVMHVLGEGVAPDFAEALKWYRKAAGAGNGNAMFNLAALYDEGQGVQKAPQTAARWVMKSILAGTEPARLEMIQNHAAWSPEFRRSFQGEMKSIGLYGGGLDGLFGPGTKSAIEQIGRQDAVSR